MTSAPGSPCACSPAARPGRPARGPQLRMLERVLVGAKHYESNRDETVRLRRGVAIVNSPLVHLGGLFRVLQCVNDGRSFCLLERFTVEGWSDAVRRHRPATASLVPAALRMVLDADLDPDDLSSIRSVVSGTAPLDPDDADAFTAKYGIPVLVTYAATEFGGSVAGWNLDDHKAFLGRQAGQCRPRPCRLRAARGRPQSGEPVAPGVEGLLEVKARPIGQRRLGPHDRPGPAGRGRLPLRSGPGRPGDHSRRVQGPPRRHQGGARDGTRRCAVPPWSVATTVGSVRCPWRWSSCAPVRSPSPTEDLLAYIRRCPGPLRIADRDPPMERLPRTESGKVDLLCR